MIFWHLGLTVVIVWFVMRGNPRIDYRVVMFGAILPDLIDKPLGRIIFRERFESGRIFAHTLLINLAFFCVLFFMRGRRKRSAVLVPISSLLHLAEDGIWSNPRLFWWPLFGTSFARNPLDGGVVTLFLEPLRSPGVLAQEAIGALLLLWLLVSHGMLSREGLKTVLRTGRLEMAKAR